MTAITFRTAWRKNDKSLERDAMNFWRSPGRGLPANEDPARRVSELCAIAYRDGKPAGVSTATVKFIAQFRSNMALYRCATAMNVSTFPPLSWRITDYSRKVLEQWSLENPDEKVMGLMAVVQSRVLVENGSQIVGPANMVFTGFTPGGFPIRVAWFKHATIPTEWPPRPLPEDERAAPEDTSQATMSSQPENRGRGQ